MASNMKQSPEVVPTDPELVHLDELAAKLPEGMTFAIGGEELDREGVREHVRGLMVVQAAHRQYVTALTRMLAMIPKAIAFTTELKKQIPNLRGVTR